MKKLCANLAWYFDTRECFINHVVDMLSTNCVSSGFMQRYSTFPCLSFVSIRELDQIPNKNLVTKGTFFGIPAFD